MYEPARDDEITGLLGYIDQQLTAIRAATLGLTEEQARATPCRSTLSVGGVVKHVTWVMRGAAVRLREGAREVELDEAGYASFADGFTVRDDETVAATIEAFDRARTELLAAVAATDPAADAVEPSAPWHGRFDARPIHARYYLVHLVEELARHAGHADILREQIDGMPVPALVLTLAGAPANDFFAPYAPGPGTLLVDAV